MHQVFAAISPSTTTACMGCFKLTVCHAAAHVHSFICPENREEGFSFATRPMQRGHLNRSSERSSQYWYSVACTTLTKRGSFDTTVLEGQNGLASGVCCHLTQHHNGMHGLFQADRLQHSGPCAQFYLLREQRRGLFLRYETYAERSFEPIIRAKLAVLVFMHNTYKARKFRYCNIPSYRTGPSAKIGISDFQGQKVRN